MQLKSYAAERFRHNVRSLMEARGVTRTELARAIGAARPGISRILSGKERCTLDRAERIARYFGVELAEVLTADGYPTNPKNSNHAA